MTAARRMPLPDLGTADVAAADQQHATIKTALDKLVSDARKYIIGRGYDPTDVGVWAQACMSGPLEAALDLAGDDDGETVLAALTMMLAEAVLRLAQTETPQ